MATRFVAYVDDDFTGKEIKDDKADLVKIELGGVVVELDMDTTSSAYQSLQKFHAKGRKPEGGNNVRPIKSAASVKSQPAKAPRGRAHQGVTTTTVDARAREWAKDNGATKLPPRLSNALLDAFKAKQPDLIPDKYKPVVTANSVNLDFSEGRTTRAKAKKTAVKAS